MGENSKIEWTDHTFNPWIGCSKVSAGCAHCYAEELMDKRYKRVVWGDSGTRVKTSAANWRKPLQWDRAAAKEGVRRRVFCSSLADVFEDRKEVEKWRHELFALIMLTPNLDWLLLTKRPENAVEYFGHIYRPGACWDAYLDTKLEWPLSWITAKEIRLREEVWPPLNIWIGTSVENQEQADKRIPHLLKINTPVRFLSCEPLLERLDLGEAMNFCANCQPRYGRLGPNCMGHCSECGEKDRPTVNWVIVGGESGAHCRAMNIAWAEGIQRQCEDANVAFFMKQLGGHPDKRDSMEDFPEDLRVREFPTP